MLTRISPLLTGTISSVVSFVRTGNVSNMPSRQRVRRMGACFSSVMDHAKGSCRG